MTTEVLAELPLFRFAARVQAAILLHKIQRRDLIAARARKMKEGRTC